MSEYRGSILDPLANLFLQALNAKTPVEKKILIDKWNEEIKLLNRLLETHY